MILEFHKKIVNEGTPTMRLFSYDKCGIYVQVQVVKHERTDNTEDVIILGENTKLSKKYLYRGPDSEVVAHNYLHMSIL